MTKYAIINEWNSSEDSGAVVERVTDTLHDALLLVASDIKFATEDHLNPRLVHDPEFWDRYDIIMVESEDEAEELCESGDYYEVEPLFHWDTSMID